MSESGGSTVVPMLDRRRFLLVGGAAAALAACGGGSSSSKPTTLKPSTTRPAQPSASFPKPTGFAVSAWSTDPFALGSYSFLKVGSSSADREALAAPIADRIFFAGEAADVDYPSTVQGAIFSGRRAADAVMEETDGTVIIVGAGAAGLAAALVLDDEDYDLVILEGRDRVGGRMFTDATSLSVPVDLGASWIHGVEGNPLTELTRTYDVRTAPFDYEDSDAYDADGEDIDDQSESLLAEVDVVAGRSVQAAVDDSDVSDAPYIDLAVATTIEHEFGADADEIDGAAVEEGEDFIGGDALVLGGYQRVAEGMATDLDITFNATVDEIMLTDAGVAVMAGGTRYEAAAVIVTVPLGVLQAGRPRFTPALPQEKQAAIGRLGMGVLSKAILEFDEVFWDDSSILDLGGRTPRTQWAEWVNLEPFLDRPMLMGFCAGRSARELEAMTPEAIAASATAALESIYGE